MGRSRPTRAEAAFALAVIAGWFAVTVVETSTQYPWNRGDSFTFVSLTIDGTLSGVIPTIAFLWLAGLSRVFHGA